MASHSASEVMACISQQQQLRFLFAVPVVDVFLYIVLLLLLLLPHLTPPLFHLASVGKLLLPTLFLLARLAKVTKLAVDPIAAANSVHECARLATAAAVPHRANRWHLCRAKRRLDQCFLEPQELHCRSSGRWRNHRSTHETGNGIIHRRCCQ